MDFVESVCEFNKTGGNANEFNVRNVAKYIGYLLEEVTETLDALQAPYHTPISDLAAHMEAMAGNFKEGMFDEQVAKLRREDKIEVLDGAIDSAVIGIGLAHCLGADVQGAALHVADSNMSKFVTNEAGETVALRDENGKILKGPNFFRPKLDQFLA